MPLRNRFELSFFFLCGQILSGMGAEGLGCRPETLTHIPERGS